jgi:hypothetical protein
MAPEEQCDQIANQVKRKMEMMPTPEVEQRYMGPIHVLADSREEREPFPGMNRRWALVWVL